jgi:hypothetical protein
VNLLLRPVLSPWSNEVVLLNRSDETCASTGCVDSWFGAEWGYGRRKATDHKLGVRCVTCGDVEFFVCAGCHCDLFATWKSEYVQRLIFCTKVESDHQIVRMLPYRKMGN